MEFVDWFVGIILGHGRDESFEEIEISLLQKQLSFKCAFFKRAISCKFCDSQNGLLPNWSTK